MLEAFAVETVKVSELRPHPQNYRSHPDDQLEHIIASIRKYGFYRNVVVARDNTILAGHGVVAAALKIGIEEIPIIKLDLAHDDPAALKVLVGDNEIAKMGEIDDRALTEMLKSIKNLDSGGLVGTGYTEQMLAALVMVTRSASEIADHDEASQWAGMPEFESTVLPPQLLMSFENAEDREQFVRECAIELTSRRELRSWTGRWPARGKDDLCSVEFRES